EGIVREEHALAGREPNLAQAIAAVPVVLGHFLAAADVRDLADAAAALVVLVAGLDVVDEHVAFANAEAPRRLRASARGADERTGRVVLEGLFLAPPAGPHEAVHLVVLVGKRPEEIVLDVDGSADVVALVAAADAGFSRRTLAGGAHRETIARV